MSKAIKVYEITSIRNVDVSKYKNGDIFMTEKGVYILHQNKLKSILQKKEG